MNGIHDMGGLHGFGDVEVEENEPVFHERWESRVFGIAQIAGGNIDAGRHSIERLDPVAYLEHGYYGRWLGAMERTLLESGLVTREEIAGRVPRAAPERRKDASAGKRASWRPAAASYVREIAAEPAFHIGEPVTTRNYQPAGHTRLPAYARCRRGIVQRLHPAMVFPDDHAHDRGENPQYLYTVRFDGRELWGAEAEPGTVVHLELFESYLEPTSAT
jgi:nitrile hydratase beta subunit